MSARTPVCIVTGFLGSGKTTLLNCLLQDPRMAGAAVIINEFGEIALDHLLVARPAETMVLLGNGCLCCTVHGELAGTLAELWTKRERGDIPAFDRVLVETTGLADPVPILRTLATDEAIAPRFAPGTVVALVDAVNGIAQLDLHAESVKQAAIADLILVSKTDIAEARTLSHLTARLARLNPGARVERCIHGEIDAGILFDTCWGVAAPGVVRERWLSCGAIAESGGTHDGHDAGHAHRAGPHDDRIRTFVLRREAPTSAAGLTAWLNMLAGLRGASLLRVKGLVNVDGRPVVVQAVQSVLHEPRVLERWPSDDHATRIVFITRDLEQAEVQKTLALFDLELPRAQPAAGFDPEAYARFVRLAQGFAREN